MIWLSSAGLQAAEQPFIKLAHSRARLVSAFDSVMPNRKFNVALQIKLDKGWHTYWENPGDSGAAPILEWSAPEANITPLPLPAPKRFESPPFTTFGYDQEVWLVAELEINPSWKVGEVVPVTLKAEYLVCKEECVPANFSTTLTLPVRDAADIKPTTAMERIGEFLRVVSDPIPFHLKAVGEHYEIVGELEGAWDPVDFIPSRESQLAISPKPVLEKKGEAFRIFVSPSEHAEGPLEKTSGLLVVRDSRYPGVYGFYVEAVKTDSGLARWLFFALVGGIILNLMPCVFPVLSIKVFSLLSQPREEQVNAYRHALIYAAGVVSSLWVLAGGLALLRASGEQLGWGFQLQSPTFVGFLAVLFSVMAFSFWGWFSIGTSRTGTLNQLSQKTGPLGDFFSGVLATVVATPCTAPFLGAAMGFAFSRSTWEMFAIFTVVGIGLALPYVVVSFSRTVQRALPRPGKWMETLKKFMAFPLLATSAWLLSLLSEISDTRLSFALFCGIALIGYFLWGRTQVSAKRKGLVLVALFAVLSGLFFFIRPLSDTNAPAATSLSSIEWKPFSPQAVDDARKAGKAVFIDFTASWCLTCQVNKRTTFSQTSVEEFIHRHQIEVFRADWTKPNPVISQTLESYGRVGIPFYLFWAPGQKTPTILPEVLTPTIFSDYLERTLVKKEKQ